MNKVSVIIPSYNSEPYIVETVQSALDQGEYVLEVIVIDDGSRDHTQIALEKLLPQIRYVKQENQGVSVARNHGASLARAEWLLFLDSDDRLLPGAIESLLKNCQASDGVVFGNVVEERHGVLSTRKTHLREGPPPAGALGSYYKCFIPTPGAALVLNKTHKAIEGFKEYQPVEDRMYWMQTGMISTFTHIDVDVVFKRDVPDSASSYRAKGLVSGFQVQIDFINWCREKDLDFSKFEADPARLIERSLKKARRLTCWEGLRLILKEAEKKQISSSLIKHYKRTRFFLPVFDKAFAIVQKIVSKAKKCDINPQEKG